MVLSPLLMRRSGLRFGCALLRATSRDRRASMSGAARREYWPAMIISCVKNVSESASKLFCGRAVILDNWFWRCKSDLGLLSCTYGQTYGRRVFTWVSACVCIPSLRVPVGASTGSEVLRLPDGWGRRSYNNVAIYLLVCSVLARGSSNSISQKCTRGLEWSHTSFGEVSWRQAIGKRGGTLGVDRGNSFIKGASQ